MGLDGVELLMDVEETFGISILDEDTGSMRTVGQLYELLVARCAIDRRAGCLTSAAFYQVRQALCQTLQRDRRDVRPSTSIDELMDPRNYRRAWTKLRSALSWLRLPQMGRPASLSRLIENPLGYAILGLSLTSLVFLFFPAEIGAVFLPLVIVESLMACVVLFFGARIAATLPRDFQTVGDLSRLVLAKNPAWFLARQRTWDRTRIWEVLRMQIVETLGVNLADVTLEARFHEDLGVG